MNILLVSEGSAWSITTQLVVRKYVHFSLKLLLDQARFIGTRRSQFSVLAWFISVRGTPRLNERLRFIDAPGFRGPSKPGKFGA